MKASNHDGIFIWPFHRPSPAYDPEPTRRILEQAREAIARAQTPDAIARRAERKAAAEAAAAAAEAAAVRQRCALIGVSRMDDGEPMTLYAELQWLLADAGYSRGDICEMLVGAFDQ